MGAGTLVFKFLAPRIMATAQTHLINDVPLDLPYNTMWDMFWRSAFKSVRTSLRKPFAMVMAATSRPCP